MRSFLDTVGNSVKGALLIVAAALLVDSVAVQLSIIQNSSKSLLIGCAILIPILGVSAAGLWLILRSHDDTRLMKVALAIVVFSLICRLVWIFVFDSYQVNDFGEYLNYATDRTSELARRVTFYTCPIVLLFGKSLLALKITNVLLATLTAWIFFLTGRIVLGSRVAVTGLLFFIWQPDLWYSITLASHDIPGLFWLSLFFYLCARLQSRLWSPPISWPSLATLSLCLGGSIFFLGAVRSYDQGAIIALAACAAINAAIILLGRGKDNSFAAVLAGAPFHSSIPHRIRLTFMHATFLLVIPTATYRFAEVNVWKALKVEGGLGSTLCYLTVADVLGTSNYDEIINWYQECPIVRGEDQPAFAVRKLLHEITHDPGAYLLHLERKNRVLAAQDAYLEWSTSPTYESWDSTHDQVKRINESNHYPQKVAIALANTLLLLLVLWRAAIYPKLPLRHAETVPILFSAVYYSVFLVFLESQSRYNIFFIFVFSWMAAQALVDLQYRILKKPRLDPASGSNLGASKYKHLRTAAIPNPVLSPSDTEPLAGPGGFKLPASGNALSGWRYTYFSGIVLLVLAVGAFWIGSSLIADSMLTLRDQTGFTTTPPDQTLPQLKGCPEVTPVFVRNNFKQLMLAYPADVEVQSNSILAVQRMFAIKQKPHHHLRFFLSTYAVRHQPFDENSHWEDTDLEYLVAVNGQVIAAGKVNDISDNEYFSFDSGDNSFFAPQMTLQLVIRNVGRIEKVGPNRGPLISLEYVDLQ